MGEFQSCKKIGVPVAIPHGGLRTTLLRVGDAVQSIRESPSHTVGLEHCLPKSLKIKVLTLSKLKQPTERAH
jgi:hypothetical protein